MPIFHVTSPDGRVVEVTAPDGATEQQAIKYAQDNWETLSKSAQSTQPAKPAQPSTMDSVKKFGSNVYDVATKLIPGMFESAVKNPVSEPLAQQVSGAVAKPIGDVAGLAQVGMNAAGVSDRQPQDVQQQVTGAMTYQPTKEASTSGLNPFNWIPQGMGWLTDHLTPDKPKDSATLQGAISNAVREGVPQLINLAGAKLAPTEKQLVLKQDILNKQKVMNAPVDNIRSAMQTPDKNGLRFITPSEKGMEAQYGTLNKQVNPAISVVNQEAATRMAANEIGLPKNQPFTPETIDAQIQKANQAYSQLVDSAYGQLPPKPSYTGKTNQTTMAPEMANPRHTIVQTPEFRAAIDGEIARLKDVAAGNPAAFKSLERARPVLVDELKNMRQDPKSVLQRISLFREEAKATFGKASPSKIDIEQARAQMFIANQLENLLEQNLAKQGRPDLVPAMREARTKLAQIHAVQDALTVDGMVSIKRMAQIDKKTGGKLLTGNLKRIATMGEKYPLGALDVKNPITPLSYFDAILGTASVAAGHAEGVALVAGKALAPALAKIGKLQSKTPDYVAKQSATRTAVTAQATQTAAEAERQRRKKERAK